LKECEIFKAGRGSKHTLTPPTSFQGVMTPATPGSTPLVVNTVETIAAYHLGRSLLLYLVTARYLHSRGCNSRADVACMSPYSLTR